MAGSKHSFAPFARLPTELRLKIWSLARQPRVVEVRYDTMAACCRTAVHPPALVHASHESRHEALHQGWYLPLFRTRQHSDRYIYFSPDLDVLYLPRRGLMGYDETARDFTVHVRDTANYVYAVAIDHVRSDTIRPWEPYNKLMLLMSFPFLMETILVVDNDTSAITGVAHATTPSLASSLPLPAWPPASPVSSRDTVRRQSQESLENASDDDDDDVELVEPQGDRHVIMDAIHGVIESFSREIDALPAAAQSFESSESTASTDKLCSHTFPHLPDLIPKAVEHHRHQRHKNKEHHEQPQHTSMQPIHA